MWPVIPPWDSPVPNSSYHGDGYPGVFSQSLTMKEGGSDMRNEALKVTAGRITVIRQPQPTHLEENR